MIKLVVFDMAGTTVNEDNVVYKTVHAVFVNNGYSCTLEDVLLLGAGKEKLQAITDILKSISKEEESKAEAAQMFLEFKILLDENYKNLAVKGFEDVLFVFGKLREKGIKVVLNTGYDYKTACLLLKKLNWKISSDFDALVTADDVLNGRPAPDMILKAMHLFQIENPTAVIKVGDSIVDIEEGKAANCGITIGVTTGAHTKEQLLTAKPTYIFPDLMSILKII